jgi:uncharacterized caspase-like protein
VYQPLASALSVPPEKTSDAFGKPWATWALLEGLRGAADTNGDHVITAGEAFGYVSRIVRKETDYRQNPRALSGMNEDFPLAVTK